MAVCRAVFLVVALVAGQASASEFTVDQWFLASSVLTDGVGREAAYFEDVSSPFTESHQVELGVSSASASYDFAWDDEGGYFSIESQIAAELVSDGSNIASTYGSILITPSVDLAFHIDGTMDFNLPGHVMKAVMDLDVTRVPHVLYDVRRQHDTFSDGLGSGTLSANADFILPAGETWRVCYDLYVDTDDYASLPGSEGEIGTATSSVNFSFTVLPEPSTLALLSLPLLALWRRRRSALQSN